ncbi:MULTISPECIES: hypothetical protein [Shewanella]|uniref:hypothetical protein n=1 Tax=Shewanella TaxID=22 RepID=UPI0006873BA9|nr:MULTISPECIES: hypothetical protein [Shewanella]QLE83720.1 hypothetical protein FLM48_00610 [Shewanella sp. Scap07]
MRQLLRYIPALVCGLLLAQLSLIIFGVTAEYMLAYLSNISDFHANSLENIILILHDLTAALLLAALVLLLYSKLFKRYPNNWFSAVLMQLPLAYISLWVIPPSFDFSTLFTAAQSISAISSSLAMLVVYGVANLGQRSKLHTGLSE